uniref:Uncharacterized protein n=1 Tax=Arundo donax TaxID=35708 RepID=A0A0A9GCR3_ARUDO
MARWARREIGLGILGNFFLCALVLVLCVF